MRRSSWNLPRMETKEVSLAPSWCLVFLLLLLGTQPAQGYVELGVLDPVLISSYTTTAGRSNIPWRDEVYYIWNSKQNLNFNFGTGCSPKVFRLGSMDVCFLQKDNHLSELNRASVTLSGTENFIRCRVPENRWCAISHSKTDMHRGSCFALEGAFCTNQKSRVFFLPLQFLVRMHSFVRREDRYEYEHPTFEFSTVENPLIPGQNPITNSHRAEEIAGVSFKATAFEVVGVNDVNAQDNLETITLSHSSPVTTTATLQYNYAHQTYSTGSVAGVYSLIESRLTKNLVSEGFKTFSYPSLKLEVHFWSIEVLRSNEFGFRQLYTPDFELYHVESLTAPWPWNYFVDLFQWIGKQFWYVLSVLLRFITVSVPFRVWVSVVLSYMRTGNLVSVLITGLVTYRFGEVLTFLV